MHFLFLTPSERHGSSNNSPKKRLQNSLVWARQPSVPGRQVEMFPRFQSALGSKKYWRSRYTKITTRHQQNEKRHVPKSHLNLCHFLRSDGLKMKTAAK